MIPTKIPDQPGLARLDFKTSKLLGVFILAIIVVSSFSFRNIGPDDKLFSSKLTMEEVALREIFTLQPGQRHSLLVVNDENQVIELTGVVKTHVNPGPQSGVMRLDLNYGAMRFKLLLNRKQLSGKLQYQINLIQEGGNVHYRLLRMDANNVVLEKSALSKIVTE